MCFMALVKIMVRQGLQLLHSCMSMRRLFVELAGVARECLRARDLSCNKF